MKNNVKGLLMSILFWGGIWGFAEATLGYLLNLSPLGLSGSIMFPIGFYILQKAYKESNHLSVIFYSGLVAGSIKLINLFLPLSHPVKVINPAFAIVLEGLSVMALVAWSVKKNKEISFTGALLAGFSWRFIYFIDAVILYFIGIPSRMIEKGPNEYLWNFLILNSVVNAVIITAMVKAEKSGKTIKLPMLKIQPVTAVCSLLIAIGTQLLFSLI
ncbi:hypothetical protein [Cellulosilyticum sp. I15G10I2]|uniref:hypothetical protein n=1 Tax=Cellulosilyticum sp. I15G10I2 TaxID=1892843 RepID=UPI00085C205C|nr:hypothetical protein [Cellulosilyticum sp. I15G10I2]